MSRRDAEPRRTGSISSSSSSSSDLETDGPPRPAADLEGVRVESPRASPLSPLSPRSPRSPLGPSPPPLPEPRPPQRPQPQPRPPQRLQQQPQPPQRPQQQPQPPQRPQQQPQPPQRPQQQPQPPQRPQQQPRPSQLLQPQPRPPSPPIKQPEQPMGEEKIPRKGTCQNVLTCLLAYRRQILLVVWPIASVQMAVTYGSFDEKYIRTLYCMNLLAGVYACEILPIPVAALFLIVALPLLGVTHTGPTVSHYFTSTALTITMSLAGAIAVEYSGLHKRLALLLIACIGTTHRMLTFGLMTVTMFMSMWVANPTVTAMMIPVVKALFEELEKRGLAHFLIPDDTIPESERRPSRTATAYLLGVSFSSNIGGIGTLLGSVTNTEFKTTFEKMFQDSPGIDMGRWTSCWMIPMILMNVFAWMGLSVQYLGLWRNSGMDEEVRKQKLDDREERMNRTKMRDMAQTTYNELGPLSYHQVMVTFGIVAAIVLSVTRSPKVYKGWADYVEIRTADNERVEITHVCVVVFGALCLFLLPRKLKFFHILREIPEQDTDIVWDSLLPWEVATSKLDWGLLYFFGTGYAITYAMEMSEFYDHILEFAHDLEKYPKYVLQLIFMFIAAGLTELNPNVITYEMLYASAVQVAVDLKFNPIYILMPVAIASSLAFMLPIACASNVMIATICNVPQTSFIMGGWWTKLETLILMYVFWQSIGWYVYELYEVPDWTKNFTKPRK